MEYGKIKGIDLKASRYVIGTMNITDPSGNDADLKRLDEAFEKGINMIDVAASYGYPNEGATEVAVGKWIESRGIRSQVILSTKGCHPNMFRTRVHSYDMKADLYDSLARLKTDYVDILYLHRDDLSVPVSEIMDTFYEFYKAGIVRAFGTANWTYERIKEANEYAAAHGIPQLAISEEHYSIAEQLGEPFALGSGSFSGPRYAAARQYHIDNNIPVASYSCLSGGFLTGRITRDGFRANPDSVPQSVRNGYCYDVNFDRLERTEQLAKEKGYSTAQIAMAYTMCSGMDVYPIIGALNSAELDSSIEALDIKLTQAECDWIDLTSDNR